MSEILVLTNAKTQSFSDIGGFFDSLKPWQINAALAGCDPVGELVLRRKYLQERYYDKGYLELFRRSYRYLDRKGELPPRLDKQVIVGRLLELYFIEEYEGNVCPKCRGRTDDRGYTVYVDRRGISRKCNRCGASGQITWNNTERYEQIGVNKKGWESHYKKPYRTLSWYLHPIVTRAEMEAREHFEKRSGK